jgi:metal-responsive CopG/Arc/MetJ family transcriptional regulator
MPKTVNPNARSAVLRIPNSMRDEVDRLVREHRELAMNRQQFIESAIRDKIMQIRSLGRPK